jgi:hypothetical protein
MTLDEYNEAVKQIMSEQQQIATATAQLAMSGKANPTESGFAQLMTQQWSLVQRITQLNMDLMMGIMAPQTQGKQKK